MNIKRLFRKLVGWGLVLLSVFFFGASITLFEKRDYGPFVTGLFFTLVSFALGLQIQTDIEKIRKRMLALMIKCFPKCPICKTDKGYEARGWLPSSQSVKCKNCGAQWISRDFVSIKKLSKLELSEPPEDTEVYATFISQSHLKLKKSYSTDVWQAEMEGKTIEIQTEPKLKLFKDFIFLRKKGLVLWLLSFIILPWGIFNLSSNHILGCVATSLGASILFAIAGHYFFSVNRQDSYVLFVGALLAIFGILFLQTR